MSRLDELINNIKTNGTKEKISVPSIPIPQQTLVNTTPKIVVDDLSYVELLLISNIIAKNYAKWTKKIATKIKENRCILIYDQRPLVGNTVNQQLILCNGTLEQTRRSRSRSGSKAFNIKIKLGDALKNSFTHADVITTEKFSTYNMETLKSVANFFLENYYNELVDRFNELKEKDFPNQIMAGAESSIELDKLKKLMYFDTDQKRQIIDVFIRGQISDSLDEIKKSVNEIIGIDCEINIEILSNKGELREVAYKEIDELYSFLKKRNTNPCEVIYGVLLPKAGYDGVLRKIELPLSVQRFNVIFGDQKDVALGLLSSDDTTRALAGYTKDHPNLMERFNVLTKEHDKYFELFKEYYEEFKVVINKINYGEIKGLHPVKHKIEM